VFLRPPKKTGEAHGGNLSNVLIAGVGLRGMPFTEANAVKAVKAICNLGLEYLQRQNNIDEDEVYFELLAAEPRLLRPFQIGYHLLGQLPAYCGDAIGEFLSSKMLASRLRRVPWIASQMDHLMPGEVFSIKASEGKYDELKDDLTTLGLVVDHVAVHCLDHLIDPFPVFPRIIGMQPPPIHLDKSIRFVQTLADLDAIHGYVSSLRIDM
jgi:hypothetical protein